MLFAIGILMAMASRKSVEKYVDATLGTKAITAINSARFRPISQKSKKHNTNKIWWAFQRAAVLS